MGAIREGLCLSAAVAIFTETFYAFHEALAARRAIVWKDQTLFNMLLLVSSARLHTLG